MKLPQLKKPDLSSVFEKLSLPLMHLMYGGIVLSFIIPFGIDLFKGNETKPFQFSAGVWAAQTWFYYFAYQKERKQKWDLMKLVDKAQSLGNTTHTINKIILDRISRISPSILKEVGLSIRKNSSVKKHDV